MARPFAAIPAVRLNARDLNLRVKLLFASFATASVCGVVGAVAWVVYTPEPSPPAAPIPVGSGLARIVVADFLAGRDTSVPVADGLALAVRNPDPTVAQRALRVDSIALSHSEQLVDVPGGVAPVPRKYEIDTFDVVAEGRRFRVQVTMLLTDDGPVLAALPSVRPAELGPEDEVRPLDYSDSPTPLSNIRSSWGTKAAEWAQAYATAGPRNPALDSRLRELSGLQTPPGFYEGLDGQFLVVGQPTVLTAVLLDGTKDQPNVVGLRVRVLLATERAEQSQYVSANDFDLVLADASQPTPYVVLYGPAGSLNELVPQYPQIVSQYSR